MTDDNTRKLIKLYRKTCSKKALDVLLLNYESACHKLSLISMSSCFSVKEKFSYAQEFLFLAIKEKFNLRQKKMKFLTYYLQYGKYYIIDKNRSFTKSYIANKKNIIMQPLVDEKGKNIDVVSNVNVFSDVEKSLLHQKLIDAIIVLPPLERVVLGMKYYGYSAKEIAEQLNFSVVYIHIVAKKASNKLKMKLRNFYEVD